MQIVTGETVTGYYEERPDLTSSTRNGWAGVGMGGGGWIKSQRAGGAEEERSSLRVRSPGGVCLYLVFNVVFKESGPVLVLALFDPVSINTEGALVEFLTQHFDGVRVGADALDVGVVRQTPYHQDAFECDNHKCTGLHKMKPNMQ